MAKAHFIAPTVPQEAARTVRLGAQGSAFADTEEGKLVKLAAESEYDLCAAGDPIEAVVASVDNATAGGFKIGSIYDEGTIFATADGAQATPGTGTLAIGDYVVCGTVSAIGTALTTYPKVTKATDQPGGAAYSQAAAKTAMFAWRVESLGSVGTGAVGTTVVIRRVNA